MEIHVKQSPKIGIAFETKMIGQKMSVQGVVSQRQVWKQAADKGYDYTIADVVRGPIPTANIDLLKSHGVIFDEQSGYFECGTIKDMSYNEAMNALAKTSSFAQGNIPVSASGLGWAQSEVEAYRTNIPILPYRFYIYTQANFSYLCWQNQYLESFNVDNGTQTNVLQINKAFDSCVRLKTIEGVLSLQNASNDYSETFAYCYSLESVRLRSIKGNISFSDSARLDNESILYMIQNAAATGITITLHPTAYARAEADAEIQEAKATKGVSLAKA